MAFALCLALGAPHPDFLLKLLTASQWQDWLDYASVFPVGPERDDWRAAYTAAGIASCWSEDVKVDQFMIDWLGVKAKPLSVSERLKCLVMAHNARESAKEKRNG